MKPVSVFKLTQDDWYPPYNLDGDQVVRVSFLGNISNPDEYPTYRVCVWGRDDFGKEYDSDNETEVWCLFLQVIGMEFVDCDELTKLGFVSA
jgi:hypothetical protein